MEKHTQAKLEAHRFPTHYVITTAGIGTQIVYMKRDPVVLQETWNRQLADARRLAAAWNACDGIPTARLRPGTVKKLVDALEAEFKLDTHMAKCEICTHMGFCEDGEAISKEATALKQKALAPFKGAQDDVDAGKNEGVSPLVPLTVTWGDDMIKLLTLVSNDDHPPATIGELVKGMTDWGPVAVADMIALALENGLLIGNYRALTITEKGTSVIAPADTAVLFYGPFKAGQTLLCFPRENDSFHYRVTVKEDFAGTNDLDVRVKVVDPVEGEKAVRVCNLIKPETWGRITAPNDTGADIRIKPRPVVYRTNCFLCGAPFRTEHDPLNVPPACNACRKERGAAKLEGNDR